jgi:hypothetical protein
MTKFKNRYVLGEGYPFEDERLIGLLTNPVWDLGNIIELSLPDEILGEDGPKYRLVLERVKKEKASDKRTD